MYTAAGSKVSNPKALSNPSYSSPGSSSGGYYHPYPGLSRFVHFARILYSKCTIYGKFVC